MRKFILHIVTLCCLILVTSCGISEDCFKGNGNQITQTFTLENFSKIKVYDGVGLVVKEGPNYEVKVVNNLFDVTKKYFIFTTKRHNLRQNKVH